MRRFLSRLAGWLVVLLLMPTQLFAGGVVLTFDDWFVDQWHDFFVNPTTKPPELNGIDLHVTFFVAHWLSDLKGANQGKADADNQYIKLKQLEAAGHEIGSHSLNHLDAKDAPYSLACNQATQYLDNEVRKSLDAMLIGDPNPSKAGLYQFRPQSYAYPYGSGLNVYDNTIRDNTNLQYLRGTLEDRSKLLKDTDAIYHKLGASRPYLIGDGIDFGYNNDVAEIKAALDRASANDEIITLYGHRILTGDDLGKGLLGIPKTDLLAIILYAQQKGLTFYRFSEAFQPSRVSGACDSTTPPTLVAPSNLTATATSSSVVNLTWKDNSNNETGFKIARCSGASCSNFSQIASTATNATSYTDTTAQAASTYRYQVSAYSGTTTSTSNPLVTVTTPAAPPPTTPSNLVASVISTTQINLTWQDNSSNEDGFKVERCTGATCTNFAVINSTTANTVTFNNTGLAVNTVYRYRVRAFKGTLYSSYTAIVNAQTADKALTKPTNLQTTALAGKAIKLTWQDTNTNETGFKIERCAGASCINFAEIATVGANVLTFTNSGLLAGTEYRYQIRAFNSSGYSPYSDRSKAIAKP